MRGKRLLLVLVLAIFLVSGLVSKLLASPLPKEVNIFYPYSYNNVGLIKNFEAELGIKFYGAKWYLDWGSNFTADIAKNFSSSGYLPEMTWEPMVSGVGVKYGDVSAGNYDAYLKKFAQDVRSYGKTIRIVLAPEMNTNWTPWGYQLAGNTDLTHKEFWKYVVNTFRAEDATNAKWVWAPNVIPYGAKYSYAQMYPGDAYVDFTGLEGYNWGTSRSWSVWQSFDEVFYSSYKALTAVTSKKILITEIGSTEQGGSKADWFKDMGTVLRSKYPQVQGFTWFNINKETDWRINSSASAKAAFIAMVKGAATTAAPKPDPVSPAPTPTTNEQTSTNSQSSKISAEKSTDKKPTTPASLTPATPVPTVNSQITDLPEPENKITESIYVSRSYIDKASDPEQIALAIIAFCIALLVLILTVSGALHTHKHIKNRSKIKKLQKQKANIERKIDSLTKKLHQIERELS